MENGKKTLRKYFGCKFSSSELKIFIKKQQGLQNFAPLTDYFFVFPKMLQMGLAVLEHVSELSRIGHAVFRLYCVLRFNKRVSLIFSQFG